MYVLLYFLIVFLLVYPGLKLTSIVIDGQMKFPPQRFCMAKIPDQFSLVEKWDHVNITL